MFSNNGKKTSYHYNAEHSKMGVYEMHFVLFMLFYLFMLFIPYIFIWFLD